MRLRCSLLPVASGLCFLAVTACGGSGSPTPSGATSPSGSAAAASQSAAPSGSAGGVDSCVVGSWKTTGVAGNVKLNAATTVVLSGGGAGAVFQIGSDGKFKEDFSNETPYTGAGSDGSQYQVAFTGQIDGTLTAANGQATLTIAAGSTAMQTISKDGVQQGQGIQAQPGSENDTYTCTAGAALSVTSGDGITTNAVPA
jgi:hypothetical protein